MELRHLSCNTELLLVSIVSFAISVKCLPVSHRVDEFAEPATQNDAVSRDFDLFATFGKTPFLLRKGFTSSRINYYPNSVASYQVTLLLRSGDVKPNPFP